MIPGGPLADAEDAASGQAHPSEPPTDLTEPVSDGLAVESSARSEDSDDEPTTEEADGTDAAGENPGGSRRRRRLGVALVAALVVVAVVATTLAAVFYGRYRDERDQRRDVTSVSSAMVTALTTYDYTNLDASRKRVLSLATGRFKQEYDSGSEPLRLVLTQAQARSTGTVRKVYVGDISGGSAETIVIADQVVTGLSGSRPVTGQQLSLTLVRVSGHWRVDGLSLDATASPSTTTPAPSGTPSTTSP